VRCEFREAKGVDPVIAPPTIENRLRSAMIKAPVDLTPAANAASFDIGNLGGTEANAHAGISVFLQYLLAGKMWRGLQR
jgi:hypothetical protein